MYEYIIHTKQSPLSSSSDLETRSLGLNTYSTTYCSLQSRHGTSLPIVCSYVVVFVSQASGWRRFGNFETRSKSELHGVQFLTFYTAQVLGPLVYPILIEEE